MLMVQITTLVVSSNIQANEQLRLFQNEHPKLKIIGVSMVPIDWPGGWFMTITYNIER